MKGTTSRSVNITTEVVSVNWFMERRLPQSGGSGSGSIIDARGYVLTNYHVVKGAYKLFVNTSDGKQHEASVIGADPQNDLAVIKFSPPSGTALKPIAFGSSKGLKVGQKVLAIGNPFGLERTLTQGIVSGLGRTDPERRHHHTPEHDTDRRLHQSRQLGRAALQRRGPDDRHQHDDLLALGRLGGHRFSPSPPPPPPPPSTRRCGSFRN